MRSEPELRGQPVAVLEGTPPLLHVIAVNDHARQSGVEIGMTKLQAQGRSRDLQVRRRSFAEEKAAHAALMDCACAVSPRVEEDLALPDTVVLDLSGLERLFGPPAKIARDLARRASDMGLEVNVAVAANAEAATLAARGFSGITIIPPGQHAERLGSLPLDVLIFGTVLNSESGTKKRGAGAAASAPEIFETLERWGVRTLRAFAALPETAVHARLGEAGVRLQRFARGEGERTLVPSAPPLLFEEAVELEYPVSLLEPLAFVLNRMVEQLCMRLSARALATQELRLRLTLDAVADEDNPPPEALDNEQHSRRFTQNAQAPRGDEHELVLRLPVPMLDAKVFLKLLQLELRAKPPGAPVEKIFLTAEPVQPRFTQGGLFLPTVPEPERLEVTLARIKQIVSSNAGVGVSPPGVERALAEGCRVNGDEADRGESAIASQPAANNSSLRVGAAELLDTHRPDAFRMKDFAPPPADSTPAARASNNNAGPVNTGPVSQAKTHRREMPQRTALRRFRPPLTAKVELRNGCPVRVMLGPRFASLNQRQAREAPAVCMWAAGPWRENGEWWTDTPWAREMWEVALQQDGATAIYRIYRDITHDQWFVEAVYD